MFWLVFQHVGTSHTLFPLTTVGMDANNTFCLDWLIGFRHSVGPQMVWSLSVGTTDSASMEGFLHNVGYPPRRGAELSGHLACSTSAWELADFLLQSLAKTEPRPLDAW